MCDSCKNEKTLFKYLNNNEHDQMGMLAFSDITVDANLDVSKKEFPNPKPISRPSSILGECVRFLKLKKYISQSKC